MIASSLSGLLLLDKPSGPTSHDAVLWARRTLGVKRVGHCGTLDPMARGLLLIVVGETAKSQDELMGRKKTYTGVILLGAATDTDDATGKILPTAFPRKPGDVSESEVRKAFAEFTGNITQKAPKYSAVKVNGRRLYEWAREGKVVPIPERVVDISRFHMVSFSPPEIEFEIHCSKGTYVRSLARDLGEKLRTGGTLQSLVREAIGPFSRRDAFAWSGNRSSGESVDVARHFIPHGEVLRRAAAHSGELW